MKSKKYLATTHPDLAAQWHPTKNGDVTPEKVTAGSGYKAWWYLPFDDPVSGKHFDFEWRATICHRTRGKGCPFLCGRAVWLGYNDLKTVNPDLASQWHPSKNGDLTPEMVTAKSTRKVWWYLPYDDPVSGKHFDFEWEASVHNRSMGIMCPFLSGHAVWLGYNDLKTVNPDLASQWHPSKNGELTPEMVTAGSKKNAWWYLPYDDPVSGKHFDFEWQAVVYSRSSGSCCPFFSGKAVWPGYNDLKTVNPELASQWHPSKNGDLTPEMVTAKSNQKVWWYLPYDDPVSGKHYDFEWQALVYSSSSGSCCPFLSGKAVWLGYNDLKTVNPELASQWHPSKNGELTPEMVTVKSNQKVWWYLPYDDPVSGKHFEFEWQAVVSNRTAGCGCPFLSGKAVWPGYNDLKTVSPELASQWHPSKNGDVTPEKVTVSSTYRAWWYLPYDDPVSGKHFDFAWQASVDDRLKEDGCPFLSGRAVWQGYNDLKSSFPTVAKEWHTIKNGKKTPETTYYRSTKKVWWHCDRCGYDWRQSVYSRTYWGRACSKCSKGGEG